MHHGSDSASGNERIDRLCDEFTARWESNTDPPGLLEFLERATGCDTDRAFRRLLAVDFRERWIRQLDSSVDYYVDLFPTRDRIIRQVVTAETSGLSQTHTFPKASDADTISTPDAGEATPHILEQPTSIGRYTIERVLGAGGYGRVYLARDTNLERMVAIKIPHPHRRDRTADVDALLDEARTIARLDHPGIVPIYDAERYEDTYYVVSRFIDGETLRQRQRRSPLTVAQVVELIGTLAQTLGYVHKEGVVHRDVKPGNLLLSRDGDCFLTDFGLALKDVNFGLEPGHMGTVFYMSPEQARGEAHLVDGTSDLFSLGVVMYELLTGVRPFTHDAWQEVIRQICHQDARPLRQRVSGVPKELERICLKLLSKRVSDRYRSGEEIYEDLQHFTEQSPDLPSLAPHNRTSAQSLSFSDSRKQLVGIIPRGLRAFEQEDVVFFHELLPGPRNRGGVPDSIHFWKSRIEATDADKLFRLGVIYGPSGSGKSSFIQAGLIPVLPPRLQTIFVEATPTGTEQRLLRGLRARYPDIPADGDLKDYLVSIRRREAGQNGRRLLIVIDQFEQWLHSWNESDHASLVTALRQCDGENLQVIVLVRDDFWLSVSRFADVMDVELKPGHNLSMVDLFDKRHARKVLAEYGRGYGRLPGIHDDLTDAQKQFLNQAVDGLAVSERVIPIQLAIFSEIMKERDWDIKALRDLGGVDGVGVRMLQEAFTSPNSPAANRPHHKAAQAILKSLLPAAGTNIKGAMRSEAELMRMSGYADEERQFQQVIRVLDSELRLITPAQTDDVRVDDVREDDASEPDTEAQTETRYYQLTHDFLVPAVRRWIERQQQLTLGGRSALRMAHRADIWSAGENSSDLPSWWEWVTFSLFARKDRTAAEQQMMTVATRRFSLITFLATVLVVVVMIAGWIMANRAYARSVVERLTTADVTQVPAIVEEVAALKSWALDPLQDVVSRNLPETPASRWSHAALLRLQDDEAVFNTLRRQVLKCDAKTMCVLRDEIGRSERLPEFLSGLWKTAESADATDSDRFRALALVAPLVSSNSSAEYNRLAKLGAFLVRQLLQELTQDPRSYEPYLASLSPVPKVLEPHLIEAFTDTKRSSAERGLALNFFIDLFRDHPVRLVDGLLHADSTQIDKLKSITEPLLDDVELLLRRVAETSPASDSHHTRQEVTANRQANATALLLCQQQENGLWQLLRDSPIPLQRSILIERIAQLQIPVATVLSKLAATDDDDVLSALLLVLGSYPSESLNNAEIVEIRDFAQKLFQTHPRASVHSAAEWLLRKLKHDDWIYDEIKTLASDSPRPGAEWRTTPFGHTLIRFRHQGMLLELSHREVTIQQYLDHDWDFGRKRKAAPTIEHPAPLCSWPQAAEYCRWLTEQSGFGEDDQCYAPHSIDQSDVLLPSDYRQRHGFRLPTVDEFEAACSGRSTTRLPFSEAMLLEYVWCGVKNGSASEAGGRRKPFPNGFFNLLGNQTEWCSNEYPCQRAKHRPIYGGRSESELSNILRMREGAEYAEDTKYNSVGFRVIRVVPEVTSQHLEKPEE